MQQQDNTDIERWVAVWRKAGRALAAQHSRELRDAAYEENLVNFDDVLDWSVKHALPRVSSGLVEQQALFAKLRSRQ